MVINRVKGHGKRATYILKPPIGNSWHIKLRPISEREVLIEEASRLRWVRGKLPATEGVLCLPAVSVGLLITKTIPGSPGHELIGALDPKTLINALYDATKAIQATNTNDLKFDPPKWATDKQNSVDRINKLHRLRKEGKELHPDFDSLNKKELLRIIQDGPRHSGNRVLTHGDLCMPNLLLSPKGKLTGVIDLGAMHLNDPMLDVALLSWCIRANMGEKWSDYYLSKFGTANSNPAIQYYRLAYDLSLNFPKAWRWVQKPKLKKQRERLSK